MNEQYQQVEQLKTLYLMTEDDIDRAVECNADAYLDYQLMQRIFHHHCDYEHIKQLWKISMLSLKQEALFLADSPEIRGMSIWLPGGFTGSKMVPFIRSGGLTISPVILFRLMVYEKYSMKLKKKYTDHKGWYLYDLVVRTDSQNCGIGKKLLRPVLEYLDEIGESSYLETHNPVNVKIYEKFGFTLMETGRVPMFHIKHYAMMRDCNPGKMQ